MVKIQLVLKRVIELFSSLRVFGKGKCVPHTPIPKGRYNVGCTDVMVGPDEATGCFFRLYYPANLENIFDHSSRWENLLPDYQYVDGTVNGTLKLFSWLRFPPWISFDFLWKTVRTLSASFYTGHFFGPAVFDADLKQHNNKFPVIIFSHGMIGCRTSYSIICTELASQGLIVAAVEHRDASACATYYLVKNEFGDLNKKWIHWNETQIENGDEQMRNVQLSFRVNECQRTLDILEKINDGLTFNHLYLCSLNLSQFKGSMNFTNLVMAGHSFGGATTLRTLAIDKRFKLGVALDSWMYPLKDEKSEFFKGIQQPILFVNMDDYIASDFQITGKGKIILKRFTTDAEVDRPVFTLKRTNHFHQSDICLLISPPFIIELALGVKLNIDPYLALDLNNRIVLQFLRKHLGIPRSEEDSTFLKNHSNLIKED